MRRLPVFTGLDALVLLRQALRNPGGQRVTLQGEYFSVDDAVLLPPLTKPIPLMIGSNGPRMLSIALRESAAWNTWYASYGNTAEGFAALNAEVTAACGLAGREPRTLRRSACVLVRVEEGASERPLDEAHPPVAGSAGEIAARLRKFADAGADEIIIVANPITERAVRSLGDVVAALR